MTDHDVNTDEELVSKASTEAFRVSTVQTSSSNESALHHEPRSDHAETARDIASTSGSNFVKEMEVVENLFTNKLSFNEHNLSSGCSTTLSTVSNENLGINQSQSTVIQQQSQIESTSNDHAQMDFLPSTDSVGSSKNAGKRTRKNANPIILLSPPSDYSNIGRERNSASLEEQGYAHKMDDTGSPEFPDSDVFYDHRGTEEASSSKDGVKPRKSSTQRKRKIGRSENRELLDLEMPSYSHQTRTTESQEKLESSDTDVACDREYMAYLEQTGKVPDVKDLKKQIKRENSSKTRQHSRSNSGSLPRKRSVGNRGWSVNSYERDLPMDTSPSKQDVSEFHSSSSEKDFRTTTPKKHHMRKRHIEHGPRDSDTVKTNSELIRKAESLSSSEAEAASSKRLKRHPTVENLSKGAGSSAGVSSLPLESRDPGTSKNTSTSANLRKYRSPRKLKSRRKPGTPKTQVPKRIEKHASGDGHSDKEKRNKGKKKKRSRSK